MRSIRPWLSRVPTAKSRASGPKKAPIDRIVEFGSVSGTTIANATDPSTTGMRGTQPETATHPRGPQPDNRRFGGADQLGDGWVGDPDALVRAEHQSRHRRPFDDGPEVTQPRHAPARLFAHVRRPWPGPPEECGPDLLAPVATAVRRRMTPSGQSFAGWNL